MRHAAALLALAVCASAQAASEQTLNADLSNPGALAHPEWFATSFLDIGEDIADAAEDDKHLMLYFYQDGCPYCKLLIEKNLTDPDTVREVRAHFSIVAINMYGSLPVTHTDGSVAPESEFARNQGIQFTPTIEVYSPEGERVFRMSGYYPPKRFQAALRYVHERKYTELPFRAYLQSLPQDSKAQKAPRKVAARGAGDLTRREADKPMMVLFEDAVCEACEELHQDILLREETEELLTTTEFVILDLQSTDALTTPAGEPMSVQQWAEAIDIQSAPTFVWFDGQGQEVFRNEGYIKSFHLQTMIDYVASEAYKRHPEFQRWMQKRADRLEAQGVTINLLD